MTIAVDTYRSDFSRVTSHGESISLLDITQKRQALQNTKFPFDWGIPDKARLARSHCDKSRKDLRRFLGRLGYLPPGGKFELKCGLWKSLPKGCFSRTDFNYQIILPLALRCWRRMSWKLCWKSYFKHLHYEELTKTAFHGERGV